MRCGASVRPGHKLLGIQETKGRTTLWQRVSHQSNILTSKPESHDYDWLLKEDVKHSDFFKERIVFVAAFPGLISLETLSEFRTAGLKKKSSKPSEDITLDFKEN